MNQKELNNVRYGRINQYPSASIGKNVGGCRRMSY